MNTTTKETEFFTELAGTDASGHVCLTGDSITLPAGVEVCIAQTFDGMALAFVPATWDRPALWAWVRASEIKYDLDTPREISSAADPQDVTFTCLWCGGVMRWEDMENGHDMYYCQSERCRHQHAVAREHWTWYVNVYEVGQNYGGPEEGGWWYDTGYPITSIRCDTRTEAEHRRDALREKYPDTGKRTSVLGGDDFAVYIEDHYGKPYPDKRPRYE